MENKQIIIDGVDVSKCEFNYIETFTEHYGCNLYPSELNCAHHPNCYFKQLARKTQECQQLINKNNRLEEKLNTTKLLLEGKNNQYTAKTQECEYWKHQAELGSDTTDKLAKQLEEKEQECENWKETAKQYAKNEEYYRSQVDQRKVENKKAEQKLERIKDIASKVLLNTHNLEQFKDADALFGSLLEIYKIIDKVK